MTDLNDKKFRVGVYNWPIEDTEEEMQERHVYERRLLSLVIEEIKNTGLNDLSPLADKILPKIVLALKHPEKISTINLSQSIQMKLEQLQRLPFFTSLNEAKEKLDRLISKK